MPAFLAQIGVTLGGIAVSMLGQLVTERFVKHMVVRALEVVVNKTATDTDNKLLDDAKQAWNVQ